MYIYDDLRRNKITLDQLLTNHPGKRDVRDFIQNFLPETLRKKLFCNEKGESYSEASFSQVRNGNAKNLYKKCAQAFSADDANEILKKWNASLEEFKAYTHNEIEITRHDCARKLIDGERQTLGNDCPELLQWLNSALNSGATYLEKIFAVLTILAITRGYWQQISSRLFEINFLSNIYPGNPSSEKQEAFETALKFYEQKNLEQAEKSIAAATEENNPLWNSLIFYRTADLSDSPITKWKHLETALTYLKEGLDDEGITNEQKNFLNEQLVKVRSKYGEACFQLAMMYLEKDDTKNFLALLNNAVVSDNSQAELLLFQILCPISDSEKEISDRYKTDKNFPRHWNDNYKKNLVEKLKTSAPEPIRGAVYWRLYVQDNNPNYLRMAYRYGFKDAVDEYSNDMISFCENFSEDTFVSDGQLLLNVSEENAAAKILMKTKPHSWKITFGANRKDFLSSTNKICESSQSVCLLIDSDEQKNLEDFLFLLETMKDKSPENATIIIGGAEERLISIVDTALQQWYHNTERPNLRVQILDENKLAAQELLTKFPLFLPVMKKSFNVWETLHFVIVGDGQTSLELLKKASELMIFPDEMKIRSKVTLLSPCAEIRIHELKLMCPEISLGGVDIQAKNLFLPGLPCTPQIFDEDLANFINKAVESCDKLYFAVDASEKDLENLSLAIRVRELLTRAWIKFSKTNVSPNVPVAVRIKSPDVSFMAQRSIVLGEKHGFNWYNNYRIKIFGSQLCYSFENLVKDIYSRIALAVHCMYFGVTSKNFQNEECRKAAVDFIRWTYNRRSSAAVATSLIYRVFALSLIDREIFSNIPEITDDNEFFSKDSRQNFLKHDVISKLEEFYGLLKKLDNELNTLWEVVNESNRVSDLKIFAETFEQKDFTAFTSCEQLNNILSRVKELGRNPKKTISEGKINDYLDRIIYFQEKRIRVLKKIVESMFVQEHNRWSANMRAEGWITASSAEAEKYILAGNSRQQNFLSRAHPCLTDWKHLDTLAEELKSSLGKKKDFRQLDINSVFSTGELLAEKLFQQDDDTPKNLRQMFCVTKDDIII